MNRHPVVETLPTELLTSAFDYLPLSELVNASHVSRFWRAVARRHRTFWRKVTLTTLSTSALDFFQARLKASIDLDLSVRVDIHIPDAYFPEYLRSVVFLAISRNLHRIDHLYLKVHISYDIDLFRALNRPALRLEHLDVRLRGDKRSSDRLSANLFACHAPKLRYVRLINIHLSQKRIPLAFWAVTDFHYYFDQALSFPTALFRHCKQLQSLTVYGTHCTLSGDRLAADSVGHCKLNSVEMFAFSGCFDLMQHIPSSMVARITVLFHDAPSLPFLMAQLRGRLDLRLYHTPIGIFVEYTSRDTGMQRAFMCAPTRVELACLPPALIASDITSRIDTIRCTSSSAPLLSAYDEMQSCTRLTVSVAEDEPLRPLSRVLSLPALECVEISSTVASRLQPADILTFLESAVRPVSRMVHIALVGIELDGEASALGERFTVL